MAHTRNLRTLVETEITESTKQKVMGTEFKCMNFAHYSWYFQTQVPPDEQLTEAEVRLAWHRDTLDPSVEKCTRKVLNRKTGVREDQDCLFIDIGNSIKKEEIGAEKRQTSIISSKNNPSEVALERSKRNVLDFLAMSADNEFYSATCLHMGLF